MGTLWRFLVQWSVVLPSGALLPAPGRLADGLASAARFAALGDGGRISLHLRAGPARRTPAVASAPGEGPAKVFPSSVAGKACCRQGSDGNRATKDSLDIATASAPSI